MILVGLLAAVLGSWSCQNIDIFNIEKNEAVTVGVTRLEAWALIYIAADQGFFAGNNLEVTIKDYETTPLAVDDLLKGQLDLAGTSEYVITGRALQKERLSVVSSIFKGLTYSLVARQDRGIENIADLKGKKIGLIRRGVAEFYLGRFLDLHGLNIGAVILEDMPQAQGEEALAKGQVDAVMALPLLVYQIKAKQASNIVIWPVHNDQLTYGLLAGKNDWISQHPDVVEHVLYALAQAEDFSLQHPAEARATVQKRLKTNEAVLATIWPTYQFSLSLDQSLILAMRDEARWMIDNQLTPEKQPPDFLDYVYLEGLKTAKPEAVNIMP